MKKVEFDVIFNKSILEAYGLDPDKNYTSDEIVKLLDAQSQEYADASGKITSDNLAYLIYKQSTDYNQKLIYSVLTKVLDKTE